MLPKLIFVASVLVGVGLSYATAHFCAASHNSDGARVSVGAVDHSAMSMNVEPVGDDDAGPAVLCAAMLAAVPGVMVLALFGLGRMESAGSVRQRPMALPLVRGPPSRLALDLQRVAVLRL
ncbi:hypothetical protein AB0J35_58590 [Nonomuraea angiospora]|uniref:hypothetical protein n=1 Tax=Nonomuraea angiospora TaxID=46172 RepID=UPI003438D081